MALIQTGTTEWRDSRPVGEIVAELVEQDYDVLVDEEPVFDERDDSAPLAAVTTE